MAKLKDSGRWAFNHTACASCGSVEFRHKGKGYCKKCYVSICQKETKRLWKIRTKGNYPNKKTRTGFRYSDAPYQQTKNCEICNKECLTCLDHDHKTMKFRGWLCMQCNTSLGSVKDNIDILQKMISYLVKNS